MVWFCLQVYAWGDNDHGQQGNGTTTVNRKPTLVQGLEGQKITRVACGSSHSVAWTTMDVATPSVHEPVLFQTARDPLGASYLGNLMGEFAGLMVQSGKMEGIWWEEQGGKITMEIGSWWSATQSLLYKTTMQARTQSWVTLTSRWHFSPSPMYKGGVDQWSPVLEIWTRDWSILP